MILVCDIQDDQPVFGKIADLIVTPNQECLFVLTTLVTSRNKHHSYEVHASLLTSYFVYRHHNFVDYYPYQDSLDPMESFQISCPRKRVTAIVIFTHLHSTLLIYALTMSILSVVVKFEILWFY